MRDNKYELPDTPVPQGTTGTPLTRQESREIVTPYAFAVCPNLLGVPTAHPLRRAIAMAIDGILISGLAKASLLMILPVMGYLIWFRWQAKKIKHVLLLVILTLFFSASATWVPELLVEDDESDIITNSQLDQQQALVLAAVALKIQSENCDLACMQQELAKSAQVLKKAGVDKASGADILDGLVQGSDFPQEQWSSYRATLIQELPAKAPAAASDEKSARAESKQTAWYLPNEKTHSVVSWIKGIFADLGIGVGWAVFYFTVTIAWCHGQTIGKKLMRIKVIQLDGKELNLFGAFSRQGGYGAGLATGLFGFLQILWDPNRQAIQDKVASTVVIRLGKAKQPLTH